MKKIIAIAVIAATTAFTAAPASAQMSGFKTLSPAIATDTIDPQDWSQGPPDRRGHRSGPAGCRSDRRKRPCQPLR